MPSRPDDRDGDRSVDRALITRLRAALAEYADPERAAAQQAYLKSTRPCLGVTVPEVRRAVRASAAGHPLAEPPHWRATVLALWREAAYREERHAAIELTGLRAYRPHQTPEALPVYEELVVTGAWWDLVDPVAIHRVGPLLRAHPGAVRPAVLAWSRDADRWRRRAAIICQIAAKDRTDEELLFACIEPSMADRDFFLRKGIGWALRAYSATAPDRVRRFVEARADTLSPLSRREALRLLPP